MSFMSFMAVIKHDQIEYVQETIQEYDSVTEYLIGMETSADSHQDNSGEHMHFLVKMSDTHYKNFADRVFRKKFNLRGQARKGLPRQYGKIREIQDLEKMAAYTVKDGNIRTNMEDKDIQRWIELSFKKDADKEFRDMIYEYLDTCPAPETINDGFNVVANVDHSKPPQFLRISILQYFRENSNKIPNANTIKSFITGYMLYHNKKDYTLEEIDFWLFGRN